MVLHKKNQIPSAIYENN